MNGPRSIESRATGRNVETYEEWMTARHVPWHAVSFCVPQNPYGHVPLSHETIGQYVDDGRKMPTTADSKQADDSP
jgi:hypothetical protein